MRCLTSVRRRLATRHRRESGSALVLIPVMVVIVVFAAALVMDTAVAFTAKRSLAEAAAAAANDAANALQEDPLYTDGSVRLDEAAVGRFAARAITMRADGLEAVRLTSATVSSRRGRPVVRITVTGQARPVVGVLPGVNWFELKVTATSTTWESR